MKKLLVIVFLIQFSIINGCVGKTIDEGNRITKSYQISDFTELDVSGAFKIVVKVGEDTSLKITGGENIIPYIDVKNDEDELEIGFKKDMNNVGNILVEITVKELKGVDLSGACKIEAEDIKTDSFEIAFSGACSGEFKGTVKKLEVDLSGATNLDAKELIAENVEIEVSGASNAKIFASKSLDAEASGASNITIYGDPEKVKTDVSGASNIKSK